MRVVLAVGMFWVCASAACGGVISGAPDGGGGIEGGTPPTADVMTFAIRTLYLGEADRNGGSPSSSAWKSYGYNLDGLVTSNTSTDVCTLYAGASKVVQVDGNSGIDNSWGSSILPIVQSASSEPTPSVQATGSIQGGAWTALIQVVGLSSDPAQSSTGLRAQVFAGGVYPGVPAFDASTDWPVLASSLSDGTLVGGAKTAYSSAWISNGTFVSGSEATNGITIVVPFMSVSLPVTIHHAIITFDHSAPNAAINGTIAGVINPSELIATLKAVIGTVSPSACGAGVDGIAQQILMTQDILLDGTNASGQACSGISIGVGFTGALVANPTTVQADPPLPPNPCP